MFFNRAAKPLSPRRQETAVLIFFWVSFLLYGVFSLRFYLLPAADPMVLHPKQPPVAPTLVAAGLFLLYGVYCVYMRSSKAGKLFGAVILAESITVLLRTLLLPDAPPVTLRLFGVVEGFTAASLLLGLLLATRRGASIWH